MVYLINTSSSFAAKGDSVLVERAVYVRTYGPTTGDVVRLADTDLYIRVEVDHTVYGDECKFGGGKVIHHHGMFRTGITVLFVSGPERGNGAGHWAPDSGSTGYGHH